MEENFRSEIRKKSHGHNIRCLRKGLYLLNQEQFAEKCGVNKNSITKLENQGEIEVTNPVLVKIANAIGVHPQNILDYDHEDTVDTSIRNNLFKDNSAIWKTGISQEMYDNRIDSLIKKERENAILMYENKQLKEENQSLKRKIEQLEKKEIKKPGEIKETID